MPRFNSFPSAECNVAPGHPKDNIKVLHICETAIGGVASYLDLICSIADNVRNSVVIPSGHASALDTLDNLITFESSGRNLRSIFAFMRASIKAAKQEKPDIIFFHSSFSLLALIVLSVLRLSPTSIYCPHGWAVARYDGKNKRRIVAFFEGRLCGIANRVVNISQYEKKLAESFGYRGNHIVIENAVKESCFVEPRSTITKEQSVIDLLFVGRFDRQKGLDLLLNAFREVQSVRSDLRLHLIGSAVRGDQGKIGLPPNTHSIGWVSPCKLDYWYSSADALIVPSRWEGFGLVVPEAFRNGTPVLCSDRGALPFLIEPGLTGQIFSLADASLFNLLQSLDKKELMAKRQSCRSSYEKRFAPSRFIGEIRSLYAELVDS